MSMLNHPNMNYMMISAKMPHLLQVKLISYIDTDSVQGFRYMSIIKFAMEKQEIIFHQLIICKDKF